MHPISGPYVAGHLDQQRDCLRPVVGARRGAIIGRRRATQGPAERSKYDHGLLSSRSIPR
jgi:hypothetical protein